MQEQIDALKAELAETKADLARLREAFEVMQGLRLQPPKAEAKPENMKSWPRSTDAIIDRNFDNWAAPMTSETVRKNREAGI